MGAVASGGTGVAGGIDQKIDSIEGEDIVQDIVVFLTMDTLCVRYFVGGRATLALPILIATWESF